MVTILVLMALAASGTAAFSIWSSKKNAEKLAQVQALLIDKPVASDGRFLPSGPSQVVQLPAPRQVTYSAGPSTSVTMDVEEAQQWAVIEAQQKAAEAQAAKQRAAEEARQREIAAMARQHQQQEARRKVEREAAERADIERRIRERMDEVAKPAEAEAAAGDVFDKHFG